MSLELIKAGGESGIIDRALEIAQKRRNILLALKTAIRANQFQEADRLITELVPDEESNRTDSRVHRIAGRRR